MTDIVERLKAEILSAPVFPTAPWKVMHQAVDTIEALRAQVAELQKEAARYRWLRDGDSGNTSIFISLYYSTQNAVELDAAIDAAISATTESPNAVAAPASTTPAG